MEIKLTVVLPRDAYSVPVARRVLAGALQVLGVEEGAIADIELALTEAATNVLDHAQSTDEYEISAGIHGKTCIIEVVDHGGGFDGSAHGLVDAAISAEDGRGVQLIRALVDQVRFISHPHDGTVVHLEKELECAPGSALERLSLTDPQRGPWSCGDDSKGVPEPV